MTVSRNSSSQAEGSYAMNTLVKESTHISKPDISIKTKLFMFGLCSGLLSSTWGFGAQKHTENIGEAAARNCRCNSSTTIHVNFAYTLRTAFTVTSFCVYGCSYPCSFPSTIGWSEWREDVSVARGCMPLSLCRLPLCCDHLDQQRESQRETCVCVCVFHL